MEAHDENQNIIKTEAPEEQAKVASKRKKIFKEILSWLIVLGAAWGIAWVVLNVVIVNAIVPTGSMRATIEEDTRLVAFRLSYLFSDPQRFDVIVIRSHNDESTLYVKRIIGMPGDRLDIIGGRVYINGDTEPLDEWFLLEPARPDLGSQTFYVPQGHYFVMGDNRNDSQDSRGWADPFVPRENILGRAVFRYFPRIGLIR